MNKNLKHFICINLTVFILLIAALEYFAYLKYQKQVSTLMALHSKMLSTKLTLKYTLPKKFDINDYSVRFRATEGTKKNKRPIIFIGCSYTVGEGLSDTQKIDYKISKLTGRTTYSRAISGGGPQMALFQFKKGMIKKDIPDAQFIIYTYVPDHAYKTLEYRLSYLSTRLNLRYEKNHNHQLSEVKPFLPILYSSFLVKTIQNNITDYKIEKLNKEGKTFETFNLIMSELMKYSKKEYPDSKFIILEYPDHYIKLSKLKSPNFTKEEKKYLESLGFIVINAEELTGKNLYSLEYRAEDKDHPNEKAWDEIAPKLIKKLNL